MTNGMIKLLYHLSLRPNMDIWEAKEMLDYPYEQKNQGLIWLLYHIDYFDFSRRRIFVEHIVKVLRGE